MSKGTISIFNQQWREQVCTRPIYLRSYINDMQILASQKQRNDVLYSVLECICVQALMSYRH